MKHTHDVFVSYAREDGEAIRPLLDALRADQLNVWWDKEGLRAGDDFTDRIEKAISQSKIVIVVWSRNSVGARFVSEEANLALDQRKLLPISIDDAEPHFGFRTIHAISFRNWSGDRAEKCYRDLLHDIDDPAELQERLRLASFITPKRDVNDAHQEAYVKRFDKMHGMVWIVYFVTVAIIAAGVILASASGKFESIGWPPVALMINAAVLGAIWLVTANIEADYLRPLVSEYLPVNHAKTTQAVIPLFLFWLVFMAAATVSIFSAWGVIAYAAFWVLYTAFTTYVMQPYLRRDLKAAAEDACSDGAISRDSRDAVLEYYLSPVFRPVGAGSVSLSILALLAGIVWISTDSAYHRDWWRSPHAILVLEMAYSQSILWYYRWFKFYPRLDEVITRERKSARAARAQLEHG